MVTDDDRVIKLKDAVAAEIFTSMSDNLLDKKRDVEIAKMTMYVMIAVWVISMILNAPTMVLNIVVALEVASFIGWMASNYAYKLQMSIYAGAILTARLTQNVEKKANG